MEFHFSAINTSNQNPNPTASSNKKKGKSGRSNGRYSPKGPGSTAVKLSTDPQSVAARERRHRISDRFKILQTMVPGGTKMDTVSMLDEAIHYVKFLKAQIWLHQNMMVFFNETTSSSSTSSPSYSSSDDIAAVATWSSGDFDSRRDADSAPMMEAYSQLMPLSDSWFGSVDQETMP